MLVGDFDELDNTWETTLSKFAPILVSKGVTF